MDATSKLLFTIGDAERLIGAPAATTRRWLAGYEYTHKGERKASPPKLETTAGVVDQVLLMSFLDLVETRVARTLRRRGVKWSRVIATAELLRDQWNSSHPFALSRLQTDGKEVFAAFGRDSHDAKLLQIGTNQFAFEAVIKDSLFDVLDFTEDGTPWRFWPNGKDGHVVVDPNRAFGQPVLDTSGVPVSSIAAAYAANDNDVTRVAAWFSIPIEAVEAAVRYAVGPRLAA